MRRPCRSGSRLDVRRAICQAPAPSADTSNTLENHVDGRFSLPLTLPTPPEEKLEHSPLALVVWQIRYDPQPRLGTLDTGLAVHELLGGKGGPFPSIEQVQGGNMTIQLGASPSTAQSVGPVGWRMTSPDRGMAAAFHVDSLTVETTAYGRWEGDFQEQIGTALNALMEAVGPVSEHRLGLRYVDRITDLNLNRPADWTEWLKPWTLGPVAVSELADASAATEITTVFNVDSEVVARMRVAVFPEGDGHIGVIDTDVARESEREFDPEGILAASEDFHTTAKQLFLAALEPRLYERLKGEAE
jgi:uncharacterized protein (TIGR04255 family)